jgi:hypothetical protein
MMDFGEEFESALQQAKDTTQIGDPDSHGRWMGSF